jgi:hypothetical protein
MRRLRAIACLLLLVPLALPAAADRLPPSAHYPHKDCRRLTRQIARYADVADMARERDDELWEEHTLAHIGRLSERRARLCPQYAKKPAGEELLKMLAMLRDAAKIAARLYTWGLL